MNLQPPLSCAYMLEICQSNRVVMEELNFTEEEVCEELAKLGYHDVPSARIKAFKRDLELLIKEDRIRSMSESSFDVSCGHSGTAEDCQKSSVGVGPISYQSVGRSYQHPVHISGAAHDGTSVGRTLYGSNRNECGGTNQEYHLQKEPTKVDSNDDGSDQAAGSVALKSCLKKTTFVNNTDNENVLRENGLRILNGRLRNDADEASSVLDDNSSQDSMTSSEHRVIKRKVLRKRNGRVEIHNESITENESDDLSCLGDQMKNLHLHNRPLSAPPKVSISEPNVHHSHIACREQLSYNLPEGYQGPKALIRPMSCEPHMRNIKKTDPVLRYQKYRQSWDACKAPGERSHSQLRWDIREQMLQQDQVIVKRPQPVHQANPYVIPGDKKRKTLRWQIRRDLAQGIKPPSIFD